MDTSLLACSTFGIFPLFYSTFCRRYIIMTSIISCMFGGFLLATSVRESTPYVIANCVTGIANTLICVAHLNVNRSIVSMLRVLWLVTLVTSSCTYVSLRNTSSVQILPNDLTIVLLGVSLLFFIGFFVIQKFVCKGASTQRDRRAIVVESVYIAGAFCLRYDAELKDMSGSHVGWNLWLMACWTATLITIFILRTPPDDD